MLMSTSRVPEPSLGSSPQCPPRSCPDAGHGRRTFAPKPAGAASSPVPHTQCREPGHAVRVLSASEPHPGRRTPGAQAGRAGVCGGQLRTEQRACSSKTLKWGLLGLGPVVPTAKAPEARAGWGRGGPGAHRGQTCWWGWWGQPRRRGGWRTAVEGRSGWGGQTPQGDIARRRPLRPHGDAVQGRKEKPSGKAPSMCVGHRTEGSGGAEWRLEEQRCPSHHLGTDTPRSSLTAESSARGSQKRPLPAECGLSVPPDAPPSAPASPLRRLARTQPSVRDKRSAHGLNLHGLEFCAVKVLLSLESFKTRDSPSGPVALPCPPVNVVLRAGRRSNRLSQAPRSPRGGVHTWATFLTGDGAQEDTAGALGPPAAGSRCQSWGHLNLCARGRAGPRSTADGDDGGGGRWEPRSEQPGWSASLSGAQKTSGFQRGPPRDDGRLGWSHSEEPSCLSAPAHDIRKHPWGQTRSRRRKQGLQQTLHGQNENQRNHRPRAET